MLATGDQDLYRAWRGLFCLRCARPPLRFPQHWWQTSSARGRADP